MTLDDAKVAASATANGYLALQAVRHAIATLRYKNGLANQLVQLLKRADPRIAAKLLANIEGLNTGNMSRKRLQTIATEMQKELNRTYSQVFKQLSKEATSFADKEASYLAENLLKAFPSAVRDLAPVAATTGAQVMAAASTNLIMGMTLTEWEAKLGADALQALMNAVRVGITQGQSSTQILKTVRNGMMAANANHVATITHTFINHVAADARELTTQANNDLIKCRQWVSTLDNKTSPMCITRDGMTYTVEIPVKPISPGAPAYGAGPGKLHWRCRSTEVMVLKRWEELGIDADQLTEASRASLTGVVPKSTTYMDWIKTAPPNIQEEVLGVTRAQLLRDGKYSVADFYDDGRMITLQDLFKKQ